MRLAKVLLFATGAFWLTGLGTTSCSSMAQAPVRSSDQAVDVNELAQYYGFGEMEMVKLEWGLQDLHIADFDRDGCNDIVVANNREAKIEVLVQKEQIGPGEAEVAVDPNDVDINALVPPTRFERQSVPVSQRVYQLVCGDLNSDGLLDLVFYGEPRGLYVILQRPAESEDTKGKQLRWRTRRKIEIDDGLSAGKVLVCADLNNDRRDDLALASSQGVYTILQQPDGTLAEPDKYACVARVLGIDAGDLNGDGLQDLVVLTDDPEKPMHVRFGLETQQLGPYEQFFLDKPWVFRLADIDGRPGEEILTVDVVGKRLLCYSVQTEKQSEADWPMLLYPLPQGKNSSKRDLATADFDGDGMIDIIISDPEAAELILYRQLSQLGLGEPVRFPAFADIDNLSAADIDGDGKAEVAALSIKEKVIGISELIEGRLSFPKPIEITGEPVAVELADMDADGLFDCVYVSRGDADKRELRVKYGLGRTAGAGNDSVGAETLVEIVGLTSNPAGLGTVDVDQDGLRDVLIFVKYELPILIRQTSAGVFALADSTKAQMSLIKDATVRSTAVANVDGKAGDELLAAQNNFARSLVFSAEQSWAVIDQYNARSRENAICAVGAFDTAAGGSESAAIVLLDGQKGKLQILTMGNDNTYRFEKELNVGKWNTIAGVKMLFEALTGGEAKSILLFDGEKFAISTPRPERRGQHYLEQNFSYETKIKDGKYGNLTAGDINADGRVDIIMVEYVRNHIEILTCDAQGEPLPTMRFKVFEEKSYRDRRQESQMTAEPRQLKAGDVTADGKADLVAIVHDRIIVYPQD